MPITNRLTGLFIAFLAAMVLAGTADAKSCANRCDDECPATTKIGCVAACPFGCPPHCCGCKSSKDGCDHSGCPTCSCSSPPCDPEPEGICAPEHKSCSERCYQDCKNGSFEPCLEHCLTTGKYRCHKPDRPPEYEAIKWNSPELKESCYHRCEHCGRCPNGQPGCPSDVCWANCNAGHHPVCCYHCHR